MRCCESVRGGDCHCGQCHETFSSLTIFDQHQETHYGQVPPVVCKDPGALGLARDYRGTWATRSAVISRQHRAESMSERNRTR